MRIMVLAGLLLALALALALAAPPVSAQTSGIVVEIKVEGASQLERGQILSLLRSQLDEPLNLKQVTEDIKSIFRLGLFQDVVSEVEEVPGQGLVLIFRVLEKPRITTFKTVGNYIITNNGLAEKLKIKVGNRYSRRLVQENLDIVRDEYRKKGYFKVRVSSRIERYSDKSFGLTIIVEETPRLYITNIRTHRNEVYSELKIKRTMSSAEVDCFAWITDSGVFDERKINQDLQTVSAMYLTNGYIRLLIDKPAVKLIHNREFSRITVDLNFNEGGQYFTGSVDIAGDILGKKSDLMDQLELIKGEIYNPFKQNRDRFRLNQTYQEQGYAFVRVIAETKIDDISKLVDVVYRIIKGDKAYIGRIEFQGNRETRDFVMRREIEVRENELFNGRKLRASQQNLQRLGYFKPGMKVGRESTDVDNVLDIVTEVEETQTGTLQAQVGFSDSSGFIASFSVSKGNLFGRGQTVRISATFGQRNVTRAFTFDFIEPHVFGSEYSSDSSISLTRRDDLSELNGGDIDEERFSQGIGHPIIPLLRINFNYSITNRSFNRTVEEPTKLRSFTPSLIWNSVNNPIFPSSGSKVTLALQQVGGKILGGDTEYRRYRLLARKFVGLNQTSTLVLMGRLRFSWLDQVGQHAIPRQDRFRLGGISTLRGYNFAEVGGPFGNLERSLNSTLTQGYDESGDPLFDSNGNPVMVSVDSRTLGLSDGELSQLRSGGISERLFNLELLFPLAGDNVRGLVFYDAGNVTAEPEQYTLLGEEEPEFFDLKQSYGVGIRLITPIGVFRFEYGTKIAPEEGESRDKFDFTISSLF